MKIFCQKLFQCFNCVSLHVSDFASVNAQTETSFVTELLGCSWELIRDDDDGIQTSTHQANGRFSNFGKDLNVSELRLTMKIFNCVAIAGLVKEILYFL